MSLADKQIHDTGINGYNATSARFIPGFWPCCREEQTLLQTSLYKLSGDAK